MAVLSKPKGPLNILTINGGGLAAIATLTVLQKLLDEIVKDRPGLKRKPKPCDVFDVICGIGTGGWLALMLGRFEMDIATCFIEWYNLMQAIMPRSRSENLRRRFSRHSYYDPKRLVRQVERLTKLYGTGKNLMVDVATSSRCRHVFVAALRIDSNTPQSQYHLLRTYPCPKGNDLLEGPEDPGNYRIADAFGATGATRYFTPPWKEYSPKLGHLKFSDDEYPRQHNITRLALKEISGLYGEDVQIAVVVNVGPGSPSQKDVQKLARSVSWKSFASSRTSTSSSSSSGKLSLSSQLQASNLRKDEDSMRSKRLGNALETTKPAVSMGRHVQYEETKPAPTSKDNPTKIPSPPCVSLAVIDAADKTSLNDTRVPETSQESAKAHLPFVQDEIKRISQIIDFEATPMEVCD